MKYDLHKPCANCPFRNDITPYIRAERVEEIRGAEFACHKTTKFDEEGEHAPHDKEQHCAGSLILHEKENEPHQMMRICERIGHYDASKLDMTAPVYDSFDEMIEAHEEANA